MIELRSSVMVGEEIMRRGVNLRILYLTQFFDPEPAYKGLGFAKGLQSAGHAVSVLTGFPNYPGGKIYDGYRIRLVQHEVMQGVAVARVPLYPSHDKSAWRRLLNYATFAMSSTLYGLFRAGRCDVIYVYHPPMTAGLAAVLVGLLRRRPVVIDIQDLWPDTLAATGMIRSPRILKIAAFACNFTYRHATRISVQSPGFKQRLVERGVPSDKIDVILNWADIGETTPKHALDLTPFALDDRFNVLFAGTMGMAQGLDVILDAAKIVATSDSRIQFLLVGSGVETGRLQRRIQTEGISNCRQVPQVRRDLIIDVQTAVDVLLVTLAPDPLFEITIPSKTQHYLAVGKPIIFSGAGNAAALIEQARGGVSTPPGDAKALAEAVLSLAATPAEDRTAMGHRGRQYYDQELSFDLGISKTLATIKRAISDWNGTPKS